MRSSNETYIKVAEACSAYKPDNASKATNSAASAKATNNAASGTRSCTNCSHFEHNGAYCNIDLYDKIVKEHGFTR